MSRLPFLAAAVALLLSACTTAGRPAAPAHALEDRPAIAVTFDDLPAHSILPPGVSRVEVGDAIIAALKKARVPARGFVNGVQIEREPASAPVLHHWVAAGLPLGNHGWSHAGASSLSVAAFESELERNEPLLARVDRRDDWHWFRFPFLDEGGDPAKRAAIRAVLHQRGYRIAAVTMGFADYAYNEPYARCMAKGDKASVRQLEADWLAGAREEAARSRTMARTLYGHDIPYVLLMHLGAFDARMLPRLLAQYRAQGFRLISLEEAERDPSYAADVDPALPAVPSSLEARLGARGLPVPAGHAPAVSLDQICR